MIHSAKKNLQSKRKRKKKFFHGAYNKLNKDGEYGMSVLKMNIITSSGVVVKYSIDWKNNYSGKFDPAYGYNRLKAHFDEIRHTLDVKFVTIYENKTNGKALEHWSTKYSQWFTDDVWKSNQPKGKSMLCGYVVFDKFTQVLNKAQNGYPNRNIWSQENKMSPGDVDLAISTLKNEAKKIKPYEFVKVYIRFHDSTDVNLEIGIIKNGVFTHNYDEADEY